MTWPWTAKDICSHINISILFQAFDPDFCPVNIEKFDSHSLSGMSTKTFLDPLQSSADAEVLSTTRSFGSIIILDFCDHQFTTVIRDNDYIESWYTCLRIMILSSIFTFSFLHEQLSVKNNMHDCIRVTPKNLYPSSIMYRDCLYLVIHREA